MNTLVIDETRKSLSVECCLETKMRLDVQLLYDVMADTIGYIQIKVRAASSGGGGGMGGGGRERRGRLGPRNDVLTTRSPSVLVSG